MKIFPGRSWPFIMTVFPLQHTRRVYCAGPLFNDAERREMLRIADVLRRAGFEPFVPHADGMEFSLVEPFLVRQGHDPADAGRWLHEAIFALDTYQVVVGCGSLVMNMNGRVPDEGAVAESIMAWMLGKPVVLFKEDARTAIAGRDNPLVAGPGGFHTVSEIDRLGEVLAERQAANPLAADWSVRCPPHLASTLAAGERLWQRLKSLDARDVIAPIAEVVVELFGPAGK